jgi:hypothetical protein
MKKYIIGLGCSWTQGEGGYPEHIWKEHNGRVQLRGVDDYHLRKYEHENSWVNVLCRDHFPEYTPINLGVRGIGNRAAYNQLHFCDVVDWNNSTGIIVLMWSGFERYDFFHQAPKRDDGYNDFYSNGEYLHYKWRTAWPAVDCGGEEKSLWSVYAKMLWSEQFVASEQMMTLLSLQAFAKAHNYKIVVANAFNDPQPIDSYRPRLNNPLEWLKEHTGYIFEKFDWTCYVHNTTPYISFIQKLIWEDGLMPKNEWGGWYNFYKQRSWPSTYLTNCDGAHPTVEGYKVIASELAGFINSSGYVKKDNQFRQS